MSYKKLMKDVLLFLEIDALSKSFIFSFYYSGTAKVVVPKINFLPSTINNI